MDAGDLRVFAAVARLGGMNRAAAQLNTVQSNVTARIRLLEATLGTSLFHRHSRGVTLTVAGQRLLPYADRVGHLLAEARRAVVDDGKPKGPLNVGSLETTAGLRLPPLLASYAADYPEVDLVLKTGTTCELVEEVAAHHLEGAFVCGPVDHPELAEEAIFSEELVLVTARPIRHLDELLRKSSLKTIVFRAGCSYRDRLDAVLASRGMVGVRRLDFGSVEGILGCVAAGVGVTLLPKGVVAAAWREGRVAVHELPVAESQIDTMFVRRRDAYVSSALAAFLDRARRISAYPAPGRADAAE
ncbi:MAG TPA: LysR family transcriptional regulator [Stellaceae bacterium]|jgi:DNA-binding transcriptional LysR family regulator|nr:LysR family transcriptional regulator [Stellaceae bacterium]